MGWDAFAYGPKGGRIRNREIKNDFKKASKWVKRKCSEVDGCLSRGILDVSTCGEMLQAACGKHHYSETPWHPKTMTFNWEFLHRKGEAWAYWSARKFIEVCQKHNLIVKFSW